ncbi:DNA polymerase III subunit delta [Clostridium taeniosporum]|uniref:DNA polymerase III subunit delta n=1 Tax=Clostridium taeniosporum TaxID=394958 RepID=A0A1D7XI03_9CLOT|nr:DNA polymerase III subunit delta [Clostridium taeniosporum]AOR22968.1 DNA polymerase III subunit delta [Clostridium taeniosporum]
MINYEVFEREIEKGTIRNSYIFCGLDEEIIKDSINSILNKTISNDKDNLNLIKIDGMKTNFDDIMNACETFPLMSEKKVVIVYRANFLKDKSDEASNKLYKKILEYASDMPPYTILIMYYLFNDKREKPNKNKKLNSLDKLINVVYCDKLRRDTYIKKINDIFKLKKKNIGRIELMYFAEKVQNNFDIIKREVDKLISYTSGREITKKDIDMLISSNGEEDVFDLVELIAQRKIERAMDVMKDILYKSDQHMLIISNIQRHFVKLYDIKSGLRQGKRVSDFIKELRLPQFVCEKLIGQSNKFTEKQLSELVKLCVNTENNLKSSGVDKTMEMELLLVNTLTVKR